MYRPEIDGLRAIAVLSVVIGHFDKTILPSGYLGVDIFFVISGFVITQSLANRQHDSLRSFILEFYNRRVKRLVPALVLCVGVTYLLALLLIQPQSSLFIASWQTGITALFGLSNLYLLHEATDYFGSSAELNPFTHTWSLGVEEQFYLIFPFLLWFSGLARQSASGIRNFTLIICLVGALSLASYIWMSTTNTDAAFYLMPTRFWELAIGSITFIVLKKDVYTFDRHSKSISIFALSLLIGVLFLPQLYQNIATLSVVALTAILILDLRNSSLVYTLLTTKPIVFLGAISYSIYLWHWSVLAVSRWTIGLHWWSIPFQITAIFILAILTYVYVEKPLRRAEWSTIKIGSVQLGATGHAAVAALSSTAIILLLSTPSEGRLSTGTPMYLEKKGVSSLVDRQDYQGKYTWIGNECVLSSNNDVGKVINPDNCTFGDFNSSERRFLVIGNSFSAAELEMYKILVDKKLGAVTITSSWGASAVPEITNTSPWNKANNYYWASVIPALIKQLHRGDVILMVNDGAEFSPKTTNQTQKQMLNDLREGITRISEDLSTKGISIIYQHGNPFMREANCTPDIAFRYRWDINNDSPCVYYTKKESLARRNLYNKTLAGLQSKLNNFFVLDLFDIFCAGEFCEFYNDDGVFLYRDEHSHPSVEVSRLAQPALLKIAKQAVDSKSPRGEVVATRVPE